MGNRNQTKSETSRALIEKRERLYRQMEESLTDCQRWPTHFQIRKTKFDLLTDFVALRENGVILEVGCGNAFTTALCAVGARLAIGSDLPYTDRAVHAMSMGPAVKMRDTLLLPALALMGCNGTALPIKNESINVVLTMYALEHIAAREQAIREISRVLKPDGTCIIAVPSFMERIYAIAPYYIDLFREGVRFLGRHCWPRSALQDEGMEGTEGQNNSRLFGQLREKVAKFLRHRMYFPMPHGEYQSWGEELLAHRPGNWDRMLLRNGLVPVQRFSTILFPLTLFQAISYPLGAWCYRKSLWLTRTLGDVAVVRWLGFSIVFVTHKSVK